MKIWMTYALLVVKFQIGWTFPKLKESTIGIEKWVHIHSNLKAHFQLRFDFIFSSAHFQCFMSLHCVEYS